MKEDYSILDLGSGSGILSIAAHMCGAKKVAAVEFDIDCEGNFFENLQINGLNKCDIQFFNQDVLSFKDFDYDIILALMFIVFLILVVCFRKKRNPVKITPLNISECPKRHKLLFQNISY